MKKYDFEFNKSGVNEVRGGLILNSLLLALLAGCMSFGNTASAADLTEPFPSFSTHKTDSQKADFSSVSRSTIADNPHAISANSVMPIANTANKGYTLTKISESEKDEYTIIKYEYNSSTHRLSPVYYRLDLAKTVYGSGGEKKEYYYSLKDGITSPDYNPHGTVIITVNEGSQDIHKAIENEGDEYKDGIVGNFINQETAIYNKSGTIGDITGDFLGNRAKYLEPSSSGKPIPLGSAIHNCGTIGNITGNFIGNMGGDGYAAISNTVKGHIGVIRGDFISNQGRAIENLGGTIEGFYGDVIANQLGGITNTGEMPTIEANFIANTSKYSGGGLVNGGNINNLSGSFMGNYACIYGGALSNQGTIHNIKADFYGNHVSDSSYPHGSGGAIYNRGGVIDNIEGNFVENYIKGGELKGNITVNFAQGGAIFNEEMAEIKHIKGDFIGNYVYSETYADGGAIHNSITTTPDNPNVLDYSKPSKIGTIEGNFIGNHVTIGENSQSYGQGGAIENLAGASINTIIGSFVGNYIDGSIAAGGGAILNSQKATIGTIKGDFVDNYAKSRDGGNYSQGGAIYNSLDATMDLIEGDFARNHVEGSVSGAGGAIYNNQAQIKKISGNFSDNYALGKNYVTGGAISNYYGKFDEIHGSFVNNYAKSEQGRALGGAVYTNADINFVADNETNLFEGNYVQVGDSEKESQAVYGGLTGTQVVETGESIWKSSERRPIYQEVELDDPSVDINFDAKNNGIFIIKDKISGDVTPDKDRYIADKYWEVTDDDGNVTKHYFTITDENIPENQHLDNKIRELKENELTYKDVERKLSINFKGDKTGKIYLNNNIEGKNKDGSQGALNVTLSGANLILGERDNVLDKNNLTLDSGSISMLNNTVGISSLENMVVTKDTDFIGDVDLANREMDRFVSKDYGTHTGKLNVVGMNLLSDANPNDDVVAVYFAEPGLKNNVTNGLGLVPDEKYQNFTAYTPIYKYNFIYDTEKVYDETKGDGGYFVFTRGDKYFRPDSSTGSTGNPSDAFNPAVMASPVTSQAASSAMNETFRYVFEHADAFTQMPISVREAKINYNRYALSTDYNGNLGSLCYCHNDEQNNAGWIRPYTTFESVDYKNGPSVDAVTYGTLMGYDSNFRHLKHGWHNVGTGYIGYTGSHLSYGGNDTNFNGGLLGITETFYKGNFWTALTTSVGAGVADTRTMYGKEDAAMLMAGVASKTGYNFEYKAGRYIFQPIWQMSYTFVNTFDYTNAAGVRIDSEPSHSIQLNPKMRFIMNTENGWQPYLSAGMVWNIFTHGSTAADGVILPNMRVKPYVEYGAGLQRSWNDKFTAFGQAMMRNGGRTGIALTAGFRWALGRENDNEDYHQHKNENDEYENL